MTTPTYSECLSSMFKLQRFGIKLGLDVISHILSALGNPHHRFSAIHIAGTNGKGSVAAMLSNILVGSGYKVGCYTSPHLERFNERIAINNQPIGNNDVVASFEKVNSVNGLSRSPTFFEFSTAMAFSEFARHHVEWAVIETGMGGRLDATNILSPELIIITNISMEHQAYLGKNLSAIAGEKAGIIKKNIPVVTAVTQTPAIKAIQTKADELGAPVYEYGKAFKTRRYPRRTGFDYFGIFDKWRHLELSLAGEHQIGNASLVLAACELLKDSGKIFISEKDVRTGLNTTRWPGRLEIVGRTPQIILDGAHNLMSARILGRYLMTNYKNKKITLIVGILDDKPYHAILKDLSASCRRVIVTQPKINRAIPAIKLSKAVDALGIHPQIVEDVPQAVRYAVSTSNPDEIICIAGSLYVVGEAKTALSEMGLFTHTGT